MSTFSDEQLRQFLLRRVAPELATAIEDAIVLEPQVAERMQEQEFDLIDDYAARRLNPADREAVERHLLKSRAGAHSLRVARLLSSVRVALLPERRRIFRWVPLAALACAAALVGWFVIPLRRTAPPPFTAVSSSPRLVTSAPTAALPILSLLADVDRGAAVTKLNWPAGAQSVRLQVELPDAPRQGTYTLRIDDAAGRRLFASGPLAAQSAGGLRYVEAVVPTAALGPGLRRVAVLEDAADPGDAALFTRQVVGTTD
jgi:hypothetical protein